MKIVEVKFNGAGSSYFYYTNLNLIVNGIYYITADNETTYKNPVRIIRYKDSNNPKYAYGIRTITGATCLQAPPRPDDFIKNVIFNEEKRTTVVIWKDGKKTIVKCDPRDNWNKETALAMCYMKRALGNRGCFNETLKRYCS